MKNWIKKNKWPVTGLLIGATGGFFYWQQVGCLDGTCAITSTWHNSTAYGALMGGLLFSMLQGEKKKDEQ